MSTPPGLRYVKGHGTANDFVVLPDPDDTIELTPDLVAAICDRRRGLGADGVLRVVSADLVPGGRDDDPEVRWFMDYRNADGSAAEMCGNGIRVFARYLVEAGFAPAGSMHIGTRDGVKRVELQRSGDVTVDMGVPSVLTVDDCVVRTGGRSWPGAAVDVGNPHVVVRVSDVAEAGSLREAPEVQPASAFPAGTNVEFVAVDPDGRHLTMRVHERGVGETQSCGTGACAVVAAVRAAQSPSAGPVAYTVDVPGGRLQVALCEDGRALLTGPAVLVAQGVLREEWVSAVTG